MVVVWKKERENEEESRAPLSGSSGRAKRMTGWRMILSAEGSEGGDKHGGIRASPDVEGGDSCRIGTNHPRHVDLRGKRAACVRLIPCLFAPHLR